MGTAWQDHALLAARRHIFLGAPVHDLSMQETLDLAIEAMRSRQPMLHAVINVAKLVNMGKNAELRTDVASADIVNFDGMGVLWGARLLGVGAQERVPGIDLMANLIARCESEGFRPYLFGAEQHVLEAMVVEMRRRHPRLDIAGMRNGYFSPEEEPEIVAAINASRADCLFVALPTPHKERFLKRHREVLTPGFVMGVGGSFDVYGNKVRRAPKVMQAVGLEWLFRIMQEPRRLWRRYYETNTAYAVLLWHAYRKRRS